MIRKRLFIVLLMLLIALISLAGCSSEDPVETATEATITDMAGREITVPTDIQKVYGTNNNSSIMLYTLAPEKMIGWNLELSSAAKKYIDEDATELPVLGNMYGSGKKANAEEILKYSPDVVLLADTVLNDKVVEAADELQTKMGIPVVVLICDVTNYDVAYEFLGEVLDKEEKASKLSAYFKGTIDDVKEKSKSIEEKVEVYYARMDNGLTTEFAGSENAELIELVGATNVAKASGKETESEVSIEQVLVWNPDVIIVGHIGASESKAYQLITTNKNWEEINAVKNELVFNTPSLPFNWFDRPPSVNRIIGVKWLANKLYPEVYDYDMVSEAKEFFKLFYGYELTDDEANKLIG